MLDILIVDDHPDQVAGMLRTIDWTSCQVTGTHAAYSGAEALEVLRRQTIHLLITDIRMPGMTGIELIEQVRRLSPKTRCVLISGYADFEYAKQAVNLNTSRYMMKPVDFDELQETVAVLAQEVLSEAETAETYRKNIHTLHSYLPAFRSDLLTQLLGGRPMPGPTLAAKLADLDSPFRLRDECLMFAVQLAPEVGLSPYDKSLFEYGIVNITEELMSPQFVLWHCKDDESRIVFICKPVGETDDQAEPVVCVKVLERLAWQVQRQVLRWMSRKVSILIASRKWSFPGQITLPYLMLKESFRSRQMQPAGYVAAIDEQSVTPISGHINLLYEPPTLLRLLEVGRWSQAADKLDRIFAELAVKWTLSEEYAREAVFTIAGSFQSISHRSGRSLREITGDSGGEHPESMIGGSVEQFKAWALVALQRMKETIGDGAQNPKVPVLEKVYSYIDKHYGGDLSLQAIADHIKMHPAYLSKLFKVETSVNLNEYIMKYRLERAAHLLKSTDGKIYEIGSQLGYQTTHYFIKVFKNYFGMTPQEYREHNLD